MRGESEHETFVNHPVEPHAGSCPLAELHRTPPCPLHQPPLCSATRRLPFYCTSAASMPNTRHHPFEQVPISGFQSARTTCLAASSHPSACLSHRAVRLGQASAVKAADDSHWRPVPPLEGDAPDGHARGLQPARLHGPPSQLNLDYRGMVCSQRAYTLTCHLRVDVRA